MLFYSASPGPEGAVLYLANAPDGLAPPDYHGMSADEYLGFLRASYRTDPRPFLRLARDACGADVTLVSADRPDLVEVLHRALVGIAARHRWDSDGGLRGMKQGRHPCERRPVCRDAGAGRA